MLQRGLRELVSLLLSPDRNSHLYTVIKLAKGFASLPKLEDLVTEPRPLSPATEELLSHVQLPPRPTEITEDYELEMLERSFKGLSDDELEVALELGLVVCAR